VPGYSASTFAAISVMFHVRSFSLSAALNKLGVDTELFMYPGQSHGIPDARNRLVKSVSEMAWMDVYVRGMGAEVAGATRS
jgi:dipeptidyl aminopeptidase/acylaminoacyl peptidase